jgi:DNA-directed RNA polymerase subunit RPC12/RpoP
VSEIRDFFRHCPACGRRFHIKLVSKQLVDEERINETMTTREEEMRSGVMHGAEMITPLTEGTPITVDVEDFEYKYKCTHCGHVWTEIHEEESSVKRTS